MHNHRHSENHRQQHVLPKQSPALIILLQQYWKHIVANAESDDDITTISNEAFVLIVLENNWDQWLEIFRMNDGNLVSSHGRGKRHTKCNIQPKYTQVGGISSMQEEESVDMDNGWTNEGIE